MQKSGTGPIAKAAPREAATLEAGPLAWVVGRMGMPVTAVVRITRDTAAAIQATVEGQEATDAARVMDVAGGMDVEVVGAAAATDLLDDPGHSKALFDCQSAHWLLFQPGLF